jgi:hypothetical protein
MREVIFLHRSVEFGAKQGQAVTKTQFKTTK